MFCGKCGKQIADNSKHCGYCGYEIGTLAAPQVTAPVRTAPPAAPQQTAVSAGRKRNVMIAVIAVVVSLMVVTASAAAYIFYVEKNTARIEISLFNNTATVTHAADILVNGEEIGSFYEIQPGERRVIFIDYTFSGRSSTVVVSINSNERVAPPHTLDVMKDGKYKVNLSMSYF